MSWRIGRSKGEPTTATEAMQNIGNPTLLRSLFTLRVSNFLLTGGPMTTSSWNRWILGEFLVCAQTSNTDMLSHHAHTLILGDKLFLAPLKDDIQVCGSALSPHPSITSALRLL